MLVWPYWFYALFLYGITKDEGTLEGPKGFIAKVKKTGVDGERVIYREGEGKLEPLATVYERKQSQWPEAICAGLALTPFALYAKNRWMAARVVSISASV